MADDPRTQLRRLLAAKLRASCPGCDNTDAPHPSDCHIREPEAEYLADRLLELFPDIHLRGEWHSADDSIITPAEIVPAGATHVRFELCTVAQPITEEGPDVRHGSPMSSRLIEMTLYGEEPSAVPTSAPVLLRRRTPAERRAYLAPKREEMIAKGIDPELFDLIVEATE